MKNSLLLLFLLVVGITVNAQQDPQFTQWMFDKISFNPAQAGLEKAHCVSLFHRDQWDMLERDPKTYLLNYSAPIPGIGGAGLTVYKDALGQESTTVIKLNGAYHLSLGDGVLSAGLSLGSYGKKLGSDWRPIDQGDPTVPLTSQASTVFDFGLGLMYKTNNYYAGISTTHLSQGDLEDLNISITRTYWIMGGYDYEINSDFTVRANVLAKTDFNALQYDVNLNVLWADMVWLGASYRGKDAVAPMFGYIHHFNPVIKATSKFESKLMAGFSYDTGLSELKNYNDGSYEFFVTYCFNFTKIILKRPYSNPRFLGHH